MTAEKLNFFIVKIYTKAVIYMPEQLIMHCRKDVRGRKKFPVPAKYQDLFQIGKRYRVIVEELEATPNQED